VAVHGARAAAGDASHWTSPLRVAQRVRLADDDPIKLGFVESLNRQGGNIPRADFRRSQVVATNERQLSTLSPSAMVMPMMEMVMPVAPAPPYLLDGPVLVGRGGDHRTVERSGRSNGNSDRRGGGKRDHGRT
jgi:hypothetical protein